MDPNALLRRFLDALADGDRTKVAESLSDLHEWIARGGALPDDPRKEAYNQASSGGFYLVCVAGLSQTIFGPFASREAGKVAGRAWIEAQWNEERAAGGSPVSDDDTYGYYVYPERDMPDRDIARAVTPG